MNTRSAEEELTAYNAIYIRHKAAVREEASTLQKSIALCAKVGQKNLQDAIHEEARLRTNEEAVAQLARELGRSPDEPGTQRLADALK